MHTQRYMRHHAFMYGPCNCMGSRLPTSQKLRFYSCAEETTSAHANSYPHMSYAFFDNKWQFSWCKLNLLFCKKRWWLNTKKHKVIFFELKYKCAKFQSFSRGHNNTLKWLICLFPSFYMLLNHNLRITPVNYFVVRFCFLLWFIDFWSLHTT